MKLKTFGTGSSIRNMAKQIYNGYIIDVSCGSNPSAHWTKHLSQSVEQEIKMEYGAIVRVVAINPSPDNSRLVRFTSEIKKNKDALSFLNKEL
jgi:hypothetical protein